MENLSIDATRIGHAYWKGVFIALRAAEESPASISALLSCASSALEHYENLMGISQETIELTEENAHGN